VAHPPLGYSVFLSFCKPTPRAEILVFFSPNLLLLSQSPNLQPEPIRPTHASNKRRYRAINRSASPRPCIARFLLSSGR